jgi:hypothetical protein
LIIPVLTVIWDSHSFQHSTTTTSDKILRQCVAFWPWMRVQGLSIEWLWSGTTGPVCQDVIVLNCLVALLVLCAELRPCHPHSDYVVPPPLLSPLVAISQQVRMTIQ